MQCNIALYQMLAAQWVACVQSYQPDWQAILSSSPQPFTASLSRWLYPKAVAAEGIASDQSKDRPVLEHQLSVDNQRSVDSLPAVKVLLATTRARLEALNGVDAERIHGK